MGKEVEPKKLAREVKNILSGLPSLPEFVVEPSQLGLVICDGDLNIEYVNPRFAELLGVARSKVEGKKIDELSCGYKFDSEKFRELLKKAAESKVAVELGEFDCENAQGDKIKISCNVSPVRHKGSGFKVVAILADVTERKQAQEAQLERARVQGQLQILSSLSSAMSSPGSFKQIINNFASASESILSYTAYTILDLGRTPRRLQIQFTGAVSERFVEQVVERMTKSLLMVQPEPQAGKTLELEYDKGKIDRDSSTRMESFLAVPVVVENETLVLIGFASTVEDAFKPENISFAYTLANYYSLIISRARVEEEMLRREIEEQLKREKLELEAMRKEAQATAAQTALEMERETLRELKRIDKLKSEFVTTVSHEMRTPMTSIKSSIDLLLSGHLGEVGENHRQLLEIAVRNVDRLAQLIDDVLNVSRLESGGYKLTPDLHEVKPVLSNVLETLESKLSQKNVLVANEIPAELTAFFDGNGLTQVFTNLIVNAASHNEPGVRITVKVVSKDAAMMTISVADNGIGIHEEDCEKIFERFCQFGRTYGEGAKGTGLGLSISRSIVEAMGGKLWLEKTGSPGADFRFTLPLQKAL